MEVAKSYVRFAPEVILVGRSHVLMECLACVHARFWWQCATQILWDPFYQLNAYPPAAAKEATTYLCNLLQKIGLGWVESLCQEVLGIIFLNPQLLASYSG